MLRWTEIETQNFSKSFTLLSNRSLHATRPLSLSYFFLSIFLFSCHLYQFRFSLGKAHITHYYPLLLCDWQPEIRAKSLRYINDVITCTWFYPRSISAEKNENRKARTYSITWLKRRRIVAGLHVMETMHRDVDCALCRRCRKNAKERLL